MGVYSDRAAEILDAIADIVDKEASKGVNGLGVRVADILANQFGGQQVYFPFDRRRRNARIYKDFKGDNVHELAMHYKLSTKQIYEIINKERALRRGKQASLPGISTIKNTA